MIIPDLNLLVYAYDAGSPYHGRAADWWERCLNGSELVGLPRVVVFGFVRLTTSARVFAAPMSVEESACSVREWFRCPHVSELVPGAEHIETVLGLLSSVGTGGNLVTDAQIAAAALEHRATVFTNDTDFQRFPGLRIENPLAS